MGMSLFSVFMGMELSIIYVPNGGEVMRSLSVYSPFKNRSVDKSVGNVCMLSVYDECKN